VFAIVTLASFLGTMLTLSIYHFKRAQISTSFSGSEIIAYLRWLLNQILRLFRASSMNRLQQLVRKLSIWNYPPREKWISLGFILSFIILTLSGFISTLFSRQGLHGFSLLLHVGFGGLFAISLSLAVILRARVYSFHAEKKEDKNLARSERSKVTGPRRLVELKPEIKKILFWVFVTSGFLLIVTALAQMLPLFTLSSQLQMADVHRYSALAALLSAITFAYFWLPENLKP